MGIARGIAAGVAVMSILASAPAIASGGASNQAEKLRRLDIMLMVTGLRCRTTADNFQADYGRFTTRHLPALNAASTTLKGDLSRRYGPVGANRALDKMSVKMANEYGQGHPWLSCGQLKQITRNLAQVKGTAPLIEAADQLLARNGNPQIALAR
jgi:hypothetical protein